MIKIINRDTYHWDIYNNDRRVYCVRGQPNDIYIRAEGYPAVNQGFASDLQAINHCVKLIVGRDK